MDAFSNALNELLVDTYRSIIKFEEEMLARNSDFDLSIGEMHMIEYIARNREKGKTISDIAEHLQLSRPSVTVAINKLVGKGFVEKARCSDDARVVYVKVTRLGGRADVMHRYFHRQMIREITGQLTRDDKDALLDVVQRLNNFFRHKVKDMEEA